MRYIITLILLLILPYAVFSQEFGSPLIRNYSPKEYGGYDPSVFSILQDQHTDILYFGVNAIGILAYDGVRWKEIATPNRIVAYSLAQSPNGTIYAGTVDDFGYLARDKQGKMVYQSLIGLISDTTIKIGTVWSIKTTDQAVYFQTYDHIFEYLPATQKLYWIKGNPEGRFLGDFVHKNQYYIKLSNRGLFKIENHALLALPQSEFFKDKNDFREALAYDSQNLLIPMRTEGLFLYDVKKNNPPRPFLIENKNFLFDNNIYTSYTYTPHGFALGSLKKGVLLLDKQGKTLQVYDENNLLQNNDMNTISSDKTRNLWFGLSTGFSKAEHSQDLSYWGKHNGVKGTVENIVRFENRIYLATQQQVYYLDSENRPQEIKEIPAGQNWTFLVFQKPNGEKILLVATQYGIYQIQGTKAKAIYTEGYILTMIQSKQNPKRLITANYPYLVSWVFANGNWKMEGKWEGINEQIRSMQEDANGVLWFGTFSKGIMRIVPDTSQILLPKSVKYYTEKEGLPALNNCKVFEHEGRIIFGTEKGLYVHNSQTDKFEPYDEWGKRFCDGSQGVYRFQSTKNGKVYMSSTTQKHIGYLKFDSQKNATWVFRPFRRLPEMDIKSIYAEENGIFWVGGEAGLFRYEEKNDTKNYIQKFKCLIRQVRIKKDSLVYYGNSTTLSNTENMVFTYDSHDLKFEFASPFFDQEERTLYRYQLVGFEDSLSAWSRYTEKEYTNLAEGTYTFRVQAKNVYEIESEIGTYHFTILPPWYRTWWAYLVYLSILAGLIYLIVLGNTWRLKADKMRLERIIEERTAALQNTNQELKIAYQTVDSTNKDIRDSINAALRIQNALLPLHETIEQSLGKENFFILFRPRDIVSGDFYWFAEVKKTKIMIVADCTGHGVQGALMSMLGMQLIEKIVNENAIVKPNHILQILHQELLKLIKQKQIREGMDMSIVCLSSKPINANETEPNKYKLEYAGAMNPLYLVQNHELLEIKGDKRAIGGESLEERIFTCHSLDVEAGSLIYLFSDGYQDQFGGEKRKKFLTKRFRETLFELHEKPVSEQKTMLEQRLDQWIEQGREQQTDDITVVAWKVAE